MAAVFVLGAGLARGQPSPMPGADWGATSPTSIRIAGDRIIAPLAPPGDARRGRRIAFERDSTCVLCHRMPGNPDGSLADGGDLGPPLVDPGARLSSEQIRLRLVDSTVLNPESIMPAFFRTRGLSNVATTYAGRTILDAQQIEDLVAWLSTLR